ncbi:MAG: AhpC/TSA family protein [Planctomyces sp.]|nr:AhpC/TSA family protein [Planctomyces sp.]
MVRTVFLAIVVLGTSSLVTADENPIAAAPEKTAPLKVGGKVPELRLKNASGDEVSLASLHEKQPVVLVFFRGGWCPICSRHTAELIKAYPEIEELGAEMIGISPDSVESSQANVEKNKIGFPILSDADVSAATAFGLAFKVDDATVTKYKGFGIDLEKASGQPHHALPIPAVYIVDKTGTIVFAHSNPDYRQRLDAKTIVEELMNVK